MDPYGPRTLVQGDDRPALKTRTVTKLMSNRKRRILLVVCWPVGGIRTFLRYTFRSMDSSAFSLTIMAPDQPELRHLLDDLKDLKPEFIEIKRDPRSAVAFLSIARTIITGRFDLIHSQGFMSGLYSVLPAKISGTPHLITSHDVLLANQFRGAGGILKKQALSHLLPLADVIHSVGQDAQANLKENIPGLIKSKARLVEIRNGIDVERFCGQGARDFRAELGLSEDVFLIGFLGRFMSQKGFKYLLSALEILLKRPLPRKPLVLAFGFGGFIREDKALAASKGLDSHIRYLPFEANVAPTLRGLDVVAMPSLWEACPLLPMEAMVCGVPVIGTDCVGLREVLSGTPNQIVPAADSVALAQALEKEMREQGRERALSFKAEAARRFDIKPQSARIHELILAVMKKP